MYLKNSQDVFAYIGNGTLPFWLYESWNNHARTFPQNTLQLLYADLEKRAEGRTEKTLTLAYGPMLTLATASVAVYAQGWWLACGIAIVFTCVFALRLFTLGEEAKEIAQKVDGKGSFAQDVRILSNLLLTEVKMGTELKTLSTQKSATAVAHTVMVQRAHRLLVLEDDFQGAVAPQQSISVKIDAVRTKFTEAFELLARFGLVDRAEGWKPFFDDAQAELGSAVEHSEGPCVEA